MPDSSPIKVTKHVQIPTRDGTLLSAAIHWPLDMSDSNKYPALIEYHPYRKDDRSSTKAADHDYFANHGFVSVRLDVRGTGSSTGVNNDEYMAVETEDGYDAVEWLASQNWSNGNVGMFGSSYGGFTSYQVAMLQPPSLKAIVPIYATDDRYTDDCHYKGGSLKGYYDVGTYGTMMIAMNALPPDPELFGDGWEREWSARLDANTPYMLNWLANQRDGEYWRPGSLRGQYDKLKAATFIIGGWQDGYPNPPLRVFENIECPKKVMIGPWNHSRPDVAVPGPRIDYLHEMRRWFDLHLKNEDDGISDESPVTMFVQEYDTPNPSRLDSSGEWHSEASWPVAESTSKSFFLGGADASGSRRLSEKPVVSINTTSLNVDPVVGTTSGLWSGGLPFGLPDDQRRDEALSITYTSSTLRDDLTIAGNPEVQLAVSSNSPNPLFVAKLMDVAPDGGSALICRGILSGSRMQGMSSPEAMSADETYELSIPLDATAWKVRRGHRIRLAISGSDFPNSWPAASRTILKIETGGATQSSIILPVLTGKGAKTPAFIDSPKLLPAHVDGDRPQWSFDENPMTGDVTVNINRSATTDVRDDVEFMGSDSLRFTANRNNGDEARADGTSVSEITYRNARFRSTAVQQIASDKTHFHWRVDLSVARDGEELHQRTWEKSFPRDLM
jgi:uncharacterized protein